MERSWYAVTETCLAFTVFRDDFSPKFVALFTLLLFLKSFHWLADERVDFVSITFVDSPISNASRFRFSLLRLLPPLPVMIGVHPLTLFIDSFDSRLNFLVTQCQSTFCFLVSDGKKPSDILVVSRENNMYV